MGVQLRGPGVGLAVGPRERASGLSARAAGAALCGEGRKAGEEPNLGCAEYKGTWKPCPCRKVRALGPLGKVGAGHTDLLVISK